MDYKKIGLRVGLEIHQQLASDHKLFCNCPIMKSVEFPLQTNRKLRAVAGEMGEVDPAALYEYLRNRQFVYRSHPESVCLVELDDDPPFSPNEKALYTTLQICKMLACRILDELHVMRKTVIDGSAVTGFQRTMLVGTDGSLKTKTGSIDIQTVCLEEDSAPVITRQGNVINYRLDRLGTPLIEITTSSDIHSPEQTKDVAETIGTLLRSVDVVRGIGSIRQDVNISISRGARVEIKGFQELDKMTELIENEAERQVSLLEIKDELHKRGLKSIDKKIKNVTQIFKDTKCNFMRKVIDRKERVVALLLPQFGGILKKQICDRTFGKELSSYAEAYGYGIIHSDEDVKKYNLYNEFEQLKKEFNVGERDLIAIVGGKSPEKAATAVYERAKECLNGVPKETRVADGIGSKYTRPLPGAERMYPESDILPIKTDKLLKTVKVPKTLAEREKELRKILSKEMASQLVHSRFYSLFEEYRNKYKIQPIIIATTLLSTLKEIKRKGFDINKVSESDLEKIFGAVQQKTISKDSISQILEHIIAGKEVEDAISSLKIITDAELRKIIKDVVSQNKDKEEKVLMGLVMQKVRGRVDGKKVMQILRKVI